jgi:hypothetical protein
MDFDSIKEQLLERFNFYKTTIQDSEIYIRLKERYDTLTPPAQKAIKYSAIFFVVYFFYSIPASFVSSAQEKMTFFEENRQLTRELIRAGRIAKTVKLPPPAPTPAALKSEVDQIINAEQVLPEQKISTTPKAGVANKALVPKGIKEKGLKTSLKKLNLRQLIRVGEGLNKINSSKLINMTLQADTTDPHYFTVDYELASFDLPRIEEPKDESSSKKGKKAKSKRPKKKPRRK